MAPGTRHNAVMPRDPRDESLSPEADAGPRDHSAAELSNWLIRDARFLPGNSELLAEFCGRVAAAGVPILAAVSAPSSLAVELAEEIGTTLVGFLRDGSFNIYTRPDRIAP